MSRTDEIAQGLREPGGSLIGGLHAEDYVQGWSDYDEGRPPPRGLTSASYDLGRARAREKAEALAGLLERLDREDRERDKRFRAVMADHPEALAEYDARMAEIRAGRKPS